MIEWFHKIGNKRSPCDEKGLYHPDFILGKCTTAFLDTHLSDLLEFNRQLNESEAEE